MNSNSFEKNNHVAVNLPEPSFSNENWKTIDVPTLYDKSRYDLNECTLDDVFKILESSPMGLNTEELNERRIKFGANQLEIKERHAIIRFLLFMWNPLSWIMELAALVAIALSNGENKDPDWEDFLGIVALLLLNATIGYMEEHRAGNAVKALMSSLAPECRVKRDNGTCSTIPASDLVPGDIVAVKLGNIIPADGRIISSVSNAICVDQASLTGESLPVTRKVGDKLLSSTVCKQGECEVIIVSTGKNTFFGRAADIVGTTRDETGHLQKILAKIGNFCIVSIGIFIIIEIIIMYPVHHYSYRKGIDNILVLLMGGLPIAMPTVLSVTMALGAKQLSEKKAIVTRITAIEELAAVTILCSDKTGTLTLNKLSIDKEAIIPYTDVSSDDIIRYAAYASNRNYADAIDTCILESFNNTNTIDQMIAVKSFVPFDPTNKRTEVVYENKQNGSVYRVTKGMPEMILGLCNPPAEQDKKLRVDVTEFARRGFRSLAVAIDLNGGSFQLTGLLPIFDPPRADTAKTIRSAIQLGVQVKMITGDQLEIAKETGRRLGMGDEMYHYGDMIKSNTKSDAEDTNVNVNQTVLEADGFASVFPEHKYDIVKRLQDMHHLVAMTGDGVNDAPALAKANVGIAVADACDAARSASDIVLTEPGLSVIIDAILGSRQIFARMTSYSIYTCSITIRILVGFALLVFIFQYNFPPFLVLIIAILNDGTMLTIAKDRVEASPEPNKWRLKRIFISAIVYGLYLAASTIVFFIIITRTNFLSRAFGISSFDSSDANTDSLYRINSVIYLQVSIISQALIFITRSRGFFFTERPTVLLVIAFILAQLISTIIAVYANWEFTDIRGCGWDLAAVVWVYNLIWFFPLDLIKFALQIVFKRSFKGVKPFHQSCGHHFTKNNRITNVVQPEDSDTKEPSQRRPSFNTQMSTVSIRSRCDPVPSEKSNAIINKIDELGEIGSSYYAPHTELLAGFRLQRFPSQPLD